MNYFALPVVGRTFESIARAEENARWNNDWKKNVGRNSKTAAIRYPLRSGTSLAVADANVWRTGARTVSNLMRLW